MKSVGGDNRTPMVIVDKIRLVSCGVNHCYRDLRKVFVSKFYSYQELATSQAIAF